MTAQPGRSPRVAIIGAGMSGLLMGITLKRAGLLDFVIFEKEGDVGGTWRENRYPGLSCDVPSHLYSYSFALNPDWTHRYSYGPEIHAYFQRMADEYAIRSHIRFHSEIVEAAWGPSSWKLLTAGGEAHQADFVISASGVLHHPSTPDIEGLDSFAGPAFHTARWPSDLDLAGLRVGVIGTGSTAIQLLPEVAEVASRVCLFQRTAQWVFPLANKRYTPEQQSRLRRFPALRRLVHGYYGRLFEFASRAVLGNQSMLRLIARACRRNLEQVEDLELRRKLTPDYAAACKRLIGSTRFYPAVQRPNVDVVTESITRATPAGIETADGQLHELDALILATGFRAHDYMRPMKLVGDGGLTLDEAWRDGVRAYRTVALPGFPNFFMLIGPHSPIGNYSLIDIAELQVGYAMHFIQRWVAGDFERVAPRQDATQRFNELLQRSFGGTVWLSGCSSWYLDESGLPVLWPLPYSEFRHQMQHPRPDEFQTR